MSSSQRKSSGSNWPISAAAFAMLALAAGPASAETWLCPECDKSVERALDDPTLDCGDCGVYSSEDLSWLITYLNYQTRSSDASFVLLPEDCAIFRQDGLQAFTAEQREVWVPWILVEWYIPRQRLLKLRDGRELTTNYAKTRDAVCPEPPKLVFEIADTIRIAGAPERIQKREVEESLANLFVIAHSPEALQSGIARLIEEVEAGKHPRLPRTSNALVGERKPQVPASLRSKSLDHEVVVRVRTDRGGSILELELAKGSGLPELDQAALTAARSSGYSTAGELGVPVPSTLMLHYRFQGATSSVEAVVPKNSIWEN